MSVVARVLPQHMATLTEGTEMCASHLRGVLMFPRGTAEVALCICTDID